MPSAVARSVAIVYPGDRATRRAATRSNNRFANLFEAFSAAGIEAHPVVYHDDFAAEVEAQLAEFAVVLVWVNPIHEGRTRAKLDRLLRRVAESGTFVSAHPEVISKLGTKEVLYRTRKLGWGCDTHLYSSLDELSSELPARLAAGQARVLKQHRGNGGQGVWKVELAPGSRVAGRPPPPDALLRVRQAVRGAEEEEISLGEFLRRCRSYFGSDGLMIDQAYQERLPEGMVRCYLVHQRVAGFGHQEVNALVPTPHGGPRGQFPAPTPRLYHPPTLAAFQALKTQLEEQWVPALQRQLRIETERLPVLWDCDFLLGPKDPDGADTYVLCEINVSSVAPYPASAVPAIVAAVAARLGSAN